MRLSKFTNNAVNEVKEAPLPSQNRTFLHTRLCEERFGLLPAVSTLTSLLHFLHYTQERKRAIFGRILGPCELVKKAPPLAPEAFA